MAGESGRGCKGIVYHYYKCSGAKRKLGCKKKAIRKNWIEDVVVKYTATQVLTDTVISRIADAIVIMQEQEDTVTPVLKQQLQQCETEIRNVMKAIRQGILTDSTRECLEELEQQRDSLRGSIAQLQLERRKFTKEEIVDWVGRYKDGNIHDPDYRREIIDTFVNSVFVYDDKLILTYNYKDGSQTLTLQEIEAALSSDLTGICPPKKKHHPQDGASDCRQTPVLRQAKLGLVLKNGKTRDIIQEKRSGYVSLHTHFAYFFRFMAANLSFTQFVT